MLMFSNQIYKYQISLNYIMKVKQISDLSNIAKYVKNCFMKILQSKCHLKSLIINKFVKMVIYT